MRTHREPDGSLTVDSLTWWPALLAICFVAGAIAIWFREPPRRGDGFWSVFVGLAGVICLAGLERGRFKFDRATKRMVWWRRRVFRREEGDVDFADIHTVSLEQAFSDDGRRSNARRIDLHTSSGVIPLTIEYSAATGALTTVAEEIRTVLGLSDPVVR